MALNRLHLVVGFCLSTLGWTILQLVVTPVISRNYFPVYYKKLIDAASGDPTKKEVRKAKKALMEWDTRAPGFFHAVLSGILSIYCCLIDETLRKDTLRATSFAWLLTVSVASGFFFWDLCVCILKFEIYGFEYVLHAAFCLITYLICGYVENYPMAWHAASFLMFELSTPLMHIRWALIEFKGDTRIITFCTYVFALLFFLCRIVWGNLYAFPLVWLELVNKPADMPNWQAGVFWLNSVVSALLNTFWMYKIILTGMRKHDKKEKAQ
ncbi:hypothetical protein AAMO2058_000544800 [Amorphochlora amoebiformis]